MLWVLFVLLSYLLGLMVWCMTRLRRASLLRLLSTVMRRQLPLEDSLSVMARQGSGMPEEALAGRLLERLSRGEGLEGALRGMNVINAGEAAALNVAMVSGRAPEMLAALAPRAVRLERRAVFGDPLFLYATGLGLLLAGVGGFLATFIVPRLQAIMRELGASMQIDPYDVAYGFALALGAVGIFSVTLQVPMLARLLWWRVPILGAPARMEAEAGLLHTMALSLQSGATLEDCVRRYAQSGDRGPIIHALRKIDADLQEGVPPQEAFRNNGPWRPELMWALEAISRGAAPEQTCKCVAGVLEDKAEAQLKTMYQICSFTAVIIAGLGAGLLCWNVFDCLTTVQKQML